MIRLGPDLVFPVFALLAAVASGGVAGCGNQSGKRIG